MAENGYYLPEYKLTPQSIFKNEIIAFDVNFFNPNADEIKVRRKEKKKKKNEYQVSYEIVDEMNNRVDGNGGNFGEEQISPQTVINSFSESINKKLDSSTAEITYENGERKQEHVIENTYEKQESGEYTGHYKTLQTYNLKYGNERYTLKYYTTYSNGWTSETSNLKGEISSGNEQVEILRSPARELQSSIASWYIALRNIALVALLSVLVYIGIRIVLSTIASDKAKYQQMLVDWIVALCLVFLMHYIMSFAVTINEKIIDAISSITIATYGDESGVCGDGETETVTTQEKASVTDDTNGKTGIQDAGVELFKIEGKDAENAWNTLVGDDNTEYSGDESAYRNRFTEDKKTLFWPANDFMTQARLKGQEVEVKLKEDGTMDRRWNDRSS